MSDASAEAPTAVLLMGYGSPDGASDLPDYLTEVLHGRRPDPATVAEYVRRYERIGGSPQNRILRSLRAKLERRIASDRPGMPVYLAVKHGRPALKDVVPEVAAAGHHRVVAVATTPYDSLWIGEPYREGVAEGIGAAGGPVSVDVRLGWHLDPAWVGYWARAIRAELDRANDPRRAVLLSAHSLPERMRARGDPYPEVLAETSAAIARTAALDRYEFTYQSAGNTTEPWLGPDITEVMLRWKANGAQHQLVASFGFVFDHLEVLYDLDCVVQEFAEEHGIGYARVPMPNDADEVVEALARRALGPEAPGVATRRSSR